MAREFDWGYLEVREGKCIIKWDDDPKPDGSRNQRTKTIYGTAEEAELELAKRYVAKRERPAIDEESPVDKRTTWRIFWWLVTVPSFEGLAKKTVHEYDRLWRVELEPRIGRSRVSETTYRLVCRTIADISSPTVQRAAHRLWKRLCNQAIHEGLLQANPVDRTVPMKRHVKRRKTHLEAQDAMAYLSTLQGTRYQKFCILTMIGGLRVEEAVPRKGLDIIRDGKFARVSIVDALVTVNGTKDYKGTKNEFSERDMWIAEPFATLLLNGLDDGPLFPGPHPQGDEPNASWFANPQTVRRNWEAWCKKHRVMYIRPLDMRTIFSDWCAEAYAPDSLVDIAMGHAGGDGTTRGRNYQTRTRKGMQLVAESLAEYLIGEAPCFKLWDADVVDLGPRETPR